MRGGGEGGETGETGEMEHLSSGGLNAGSWHRGRPLRIHTESKPFHTSINNVVQHLSEHNEGKGRSGLDTVEILSAGSTLLYSEWVSKDSNFPASHVPLRHPRSHALPMADDGPKAAWDNASPESFLSSPDFLHGGGTVTRPLKAAHGAEDRTALEYSQPPTPGSQPETPRSPRSPRVLSKNSHKAGGGILTVRERGFRRRVKKAVDQRAAQKTAVFRGVLKVRAPHQSLVISPPAPPPARASEP